MKKCNNQIDRIEKDIPIGNISQDAIKNENSYKTYYGILFCHKRTIMYI